MGAVVTSMDPAQEAMRLAFEEHYLPLVRLCVLLAGNRDVAEDIVQDAFVRVAGRIDHVEAQQVGAYLRRVAVNVWKNRLRRLSLENRLRTQPQADIAEEQALVDERDRLWHAVRRLPKRQQACVVLRYWEDLSESDVAAILGCSAGTVKSHTSRAMARLRKEVLRDD